MSFGLFLKFEFDDARQKRSKDIRDMHHHFANNNSCENANSSDDEQI
jgi:hypothetical protein